MSIDPNQWKNLANTPAHAAAKEELKKWLPRTNAKHFRGGAKQVK